MRGEAEVRAQLKELREILKGSSCPEAVGAKHALIWVLELHGVMTPAQAYYDFVKFWNTIRPTKEEDDSCQW